MAVTTEAAAPYAPISVMMDIIQRHRDRGLPKPINGETLQRAGLVTESLTSRTVQALTVLDLVDQAGNPTPVFEGIRLAPETEYKKRLEEWLKGAYADVFSFTDPSKDDLTQIGDAFRTYTPPGQRDRMVNLFVGFCKAAGLMTETATQMPKPKPASSAAHAAPKKVTIKLAQKGSANGYSQDQFTNSLPPALLGLLQSLPNPSVGWLQSERDKFNIQTMNIN